MSTERLAINIALRGHNVAVAEKATQGTISAHAQILALTVNAYNKARGHGAPHILPRGNAGELITLKESFPSTFRSFDSISSYF